MAGTHQIWVHDIERGTTKAFSGNGYERNQNGRMWVPLVPDPRAAGSIPRQLPWSRLHVRAPPVSVRGA